MEGVGLMADKPKKPEYKTVKDVTDALDFKIAEQEELAQKAIKFTDRRQARVKADVLKEFRQEIG